MGYQYVICCMSPLWRLEFCRWLLYFWKFSASLFVMAPLACCCFVPTILWSSNIFFVVGCISIWSLILRHPSLSLFFFFAIFCLLSVLFSSLFFCQSRVTSAIYLRCSVLPVGNHIQVMPAVHVVFLIDHVDFISTFILFIDSDHFKISINVTEFTS